MLPLGSFALDGVVRVLVAGAKELDFSLGVGAVDRIIGSVPAGTETVHGALGEDSIEERGRELDI